MTQNLEEYELKEEEKTIKKDEISCNINRYSQFACFSWDRYGKVYISEIYDSDSGELNGEVRYIDPIKSLSVQRERGETAEQSSEIIDDISWAVTAMIYTERYLVCALANGCIDMVNMHFDDEDLEKYHLGSSYKSLSVDKNLKFRN